MSTDVSSKGMTRFVSAISNSPARSDIIVDR